METRRRRFAEELARYGPESRAARRGAVSRAEAAAYVLSFAKARSENFPVLGPWLPARLRPHFAAVYAFCRWADDLGDEVGDPERSLALLDWWERQLLDMYAGEASHPVMVALADAVERFEIPPQPWLDLLSAFRQDQVQRRYRTTEELLDYCRRSANPVGRIVLHLTERRTPNRVELSDSICTGLQLANFCQDAAVDYFDKGRIYFPLSVREKHGVTERTFELRLATAEFRSMMREEVGRAESHLLAGLPLADAMPGRFRLMVALFAHGGLAILRRIRAIRYNVLAARPRLRAWGRIEAFLRASWGVYRSGAALRARDPRTGADAESAS